ncbi:hypothetical protein Ccrd_011554 [Cynara cardunculus var. scolymus]|uniref:Uncharacterized protein n=1 Tax=Cynara cardunculus var. scolymus TaxID=59895 RepID=A0A124SHM8_CYNCS|nr:hypothetical protein Ccrd_011554 [Cynara cardunculus var. scolymus]
MVCSARILDVSYPLTPSVSSHLPAAHHNSRYLCRNLKSTVRWRLMSSDPDASKFAAAAAAASIDADSAEKNAAGFCIIEGPETVQDFDKMDVQEIQDNIRSRRNKIFLHMEEVSKFLRFFICNIAGILQLRCDLVRRLRIQQRIKSAELGIPEEEQDGELPNFPSFIPFLPPLSSANLKQYYATCFSLISGIIIFGGLLAPTLELKLGIGGTSYADFISSMHLPMQLSEVDPIVASFSGGAVGVISALMVVEINNVKQQEHKRCKYCLGTGYLACARCASTGAIVLIDPVASANGGNQPLSPPKTERCSN